MTTRTRYSAEFLYPGSFFPEETFRDIPEPTLEAALAVQPDEPDEDSFFTKDGWYAVRIWTIIEKQYVADDGDTTWVKTKDSKYSYIVGEKVHYADPSLAGDEFDILRSNIRYNDNDGFGVKTRVGNWQIASDWNEVITL